MQYLLLLLGFVLLIFSGRLLIKCSISIARRLQLSSFVIGLTVVAAGTSAPELLISLTGALKGHADLAVYNVVGSNISNVLLVLAISALILPIVVQSRTIWFDGTGMLLFSLLLWLLIRDLTISAAEGASLFLLLVVYVAISVYRSRRDHLDDEAPVTGDMKPRTAVLGILAASGGLALGADMLVDNAILVAREFGLSERIISVSMIAVGTSIPELTTSAIAAFRKETDISIGNILGSNIFNIGFVLGITTMVKPLGANPLILSFDIYWFAGIAFLLIIVMIIPPMLKLSRWKALIMLLLYLVYLYLILK
jgi:cation:H+ antiporter